MRLGGYESAWWERSSCLIRKRREATPELLVDDDVADRNRLKLGREIAIIGVRPGDAAEADSKQVAVVTHVASVVTYSRRSAVCCSRLSRI
jgi:hypothetical protein